MMITFILLSGCDTLNSLRMMGINSGVEPVVSNEKSVELNARFIGDKPYLHARVNGEELLFLVDTGARFLMLFDTKKVKGMGLPKGFNLALTGWGEEEDTKAFQTEIDTFDLGGVKFSGLKAAYIPVSSSPYFLREDEVYIDGVIGHDMMEHFVWEFDKANNRIAVSLERYHPSADAQSFKLDSFLGKKSIVGDLTFNENHRAEGEFIIDTGSRHYLKISSQYPANHHIKIGRTTVTAADFGLSGKVEHQRVTLPELKLGKLKLKNVKTNLIPSKDEDEDDFWVIGNALLNQFKTVIDYPNEKMYLQPMQPFKVRYNLLGLELRKIHSGEFVIRYVSPDFAVSRFDFREGDLVTELAGRPATDLSMSDMLNLSAVTGIKTVCIQRDELCFEVPVQHVKGYSSFD